jgi:hypothetical protein
MQYVSSRRDKAGYFRERESLAKKQFKIRQKGKMEEKTNGDHKLNKTLLQEKEIWKSEIMRL